MAERLELHDMQRLILEGYARRRFSRYALLRIRPRAAAQARAWLARVLQDDRIGTANERSKGDRYQLSLAFTHAGLEAIGLRGARGFLAPFREGMVTEARSADLGDTDSSQPDQWLWGGREQPAIHALLMLFSTSAPEREADWADLQPGLEAWIEPQPHWIDGYIREDRAEHFGFRDGISQPYILGSETSRRLPEKAARFDSVEPGEFILGYLNEAGVRPTSPSIARELDRGDVLPPRTSDASQRDFGRNGTYLVLRQLRQDVEGFEKYVDTQLRGRLPDPDDERKWIKAKMVGRWPSGAPLVKAPHADRRGLADDNEFGFYESDRYGHACPVGSHIRRSNPRDSLVDPLRGITPDEALRRSRRHRLIRRGRLYDAPGTRAGKGVLFLCLNANIQDQFEFVQHNWLNSTRFSGLDGETDPLVGPRPDPSGTCPMSIPDAYGTRRIHGLPRFVDVVGGAYFFLPGIRALRCLAALRD